MVKQDYLRDSVNGHRESMNDVKPEISIIMPVRDTPEYALKESLESIFSQVFDEFELICIDDGSTEILTRNMLVLYEKKDYRMRVIWLNNSVGVGTARNIGLSEAKGRYIIFLDSDDYFPPKYLKELYVCIENKCMDVCITGFSIFNEDGEEKIINSVHKMNRCFSSYLEAGDLLVEGTLSACNKLVRADYLKSENIRFSSTKTDDDVLYGALVLLCTKKITILEDSEGFFYRFNTNYQLSANMNPLDLFIGILNVKQELKNRNMYNINAECMITTYLIHTGIMEMNHCKDDKLNSDFYNQVLEYLVNNQVAIQMKQIIVYRARWLSLPFESRWYELIGNYEAQLNNSKDEIVRIINDLGKPLIIWGRGKRGKAFERFANELGIEIYAICDMTNTGCGTYDEYNNYIIRTDEVLEMKDVGLIATNNVIFDDLKEKGLEAISLEDYCEL